MASLSDWKVPASVQPKPKDYAYDLEAALSAVVGVRSVIPPDAFTADTLGTERAGNGVLTITYDPAAGTCEPDVLPDDDLPDVIEATPPFTG